MKFLYYEWVKLIRQKTFFLLLIILCVSELFFVFLQKNIDGNNEIETKIIAQIETQLDKLGKDEQLNYLQEEKEYYEKAFRYYQEEFLGEHEVELSKSEFSRYQNENKEEIIIYQDTLTDYVNYYEKIYQYKDYIQQVKDKTELMEEGPLWNTYDESRKKEMIRQAEAYQKLSTQNVEIVNYQGVESFANNSIVRLLSILLMCGIVIFVYKDDDADMKELLFSTANGQKITAVYKLLFVILISFIFTFLFMGYDYLLHIVFYGYCPMDVAIQSIPSLYESPYAFTIMQWFLISSLHFSLFISMLGIFFSMLYQLYADKLLSILTFIFLLAIEMICFYLIRDTSILSALTSWNILRYIIGISLYLNMPAYSIFSFVLSYPTILAMSMFLIGILSSIIYFVIYGKQRINLRFHFPSITVTSTNLFLQENYLLLWKNKGIFVIIAVMFYTGLTFYRNYTSTEIIRENEKAVYQVYEPYLGKMNKEKSELLEEKQKEYQIIDAEYDALKKQYQNDEITYEQYKQKEEELQKETRNAILLEEVIQSWQMYPEYIAYGKGYSAIYSLRMPEKDLKDGIVVMLSIILLLSGLFVENRQQESLLITTECGKSKRRNRKWLCACLWGSVIFLSVQLLSYLHYYLLYPMTQQDAPLGSIGIEAMNVTFPLSPEMNVMQYGLALVGTRMFGLISLLILCVFISRKCHHRILSICILSTIVFFPVCLYMADIEIVKLFSLFDLVMGNLFLQRTFSLSKLIILLLLDLIMVLDIRYDMKE